MVGFILVCLFVSVLYSSIVKASMMNKPPTKRISYLSDLVKERNIKPLIMARTYLTELIKANTEFFFTDISY